MSKSHGCCSRRLTRDEKSSLKRKIQTIGFLFTTVWAGAIILYIILPSIQPKNQNQQSNEGSINQGSNSQATISQDNLFIGTQAIIDPNWESYRIAPYAGHEYSEERYDMLSEFRDGIASTGSNHFKFKLSYNSCKSYKLPSCMDKRVSSLTELSKAPEISATLADPRFRWYHIWTYSYNIPNIMAKEYTQELIDQEFNETYDWAVHILNTYQNTSKVFFVGNWEGDWELMWASGCRQEGKYNFDCIPSRENIDKYIRWARTRQSAIDLAKATVNVEGVDIFYYIEFNLEHHNYWPHPISPYLARPTILNSVVPAVNPDFLSYSSYMSTNKYMNHRRPLFNQTQVDQSFSNILDYAESKLQDKGGNHFEVMGEDSKRIFIGEFGIMRRDDPALFVPTAAHIFRAALEWGCSFILYWEIYDNYSNTEPLVPIGTKSLADPNPLLQFFNKWSEEARQFVNEEKPSSKDLRLWAVQWFASVTETE